MAENVHPPAGGRVSPAMSVDSSPPSVHTPLMGDQQHSISIVPTEDSNNNYDTNDVQQRQNLQSAHSSTSSFTSLPPQFHQSTQQTYPIYPHLLPFHYPHSTIGAEVSGPCGSSSTSSLPSSSLPSSSSCFQPRQGQSSVGAGTGPLLQHLALQHREYDQSLSEGMDLSMTVCPTLEYGDTPTFSLSGEQSFSSSHFLENGSMPTICTPLMETKSETCSFILPLTGAGTSCCGGDKSDTASIQINICRICHMSGEDGCEVLISPCRCAGTLQFIHNTCLQRWLEIMSKKSRKPPKCELCHFQYHRHKKFKFHHWRFPRVSRQDKVLHIIFLANLVMMIGCAVATVMSFLSDKGTIHHNPPGNNVELSTEEIVTLSCGVLFFVSFFIAMSVQIKAKHTIYQLFVKFIMQNMEWEIDEYDKSKDALYKDLYRGLPVYV